MRFSIIWCILPGTSSGKQWPDHTIMGSTRIALFDWQEGKGPARICLRCHVPWCLWTCIISSRRQRKSYAPRSWPWSGHHVGEVHDCQQPQRGVEICGHEMGKPHGPSQSSCPKTRTRCIQRGWLPIPVDRRATSSATTLRTQAWI